MKKYYNFNYNTLSNVAFIMNGILPIKCTLCAVLQIIHNPNPRYRSLSMDCVPYIYPELKTIYLFYNYNDFCCRHGRSVPDGWRTQGRELCGVIKFRSLIGRLSIASAFDSLKKKIEMKYSLLLPFINVISLVKAFYDVFSVINIS
jgi:hypothetical protein